jgi:transcriptional regulator with XRE-family HTH domain
MTAELDSSTTPLETLRRLAGLSRRELSERSGVSAEAIRQLNELTPARVYVQPRTSAACSASVPITLFPPQQKENRPYE